MNVRLCRWIFVSLLLTYFGVAILSEPQTIGASAVWSNGDYRFSGGTQPWFLVMAVLILIAYHASLNPKMGGPGPPLPGVARRFAAFWLDFLLAMMVIAPLIGMLSVLIEWRRTGVFAWTFQREVENATDRFLTIGGAGLCFVFLFFYFLIPLVRRRPSPGGCITGYQVLPDEGSEFTVRDAVARTLLGTVALVGWVVAPFVYRQRRKGKFWVDRICNTRAVLLVFD